MAEGRLFFAFVLALALPLLPEGVDLASLADLVGVSTAVEGVGAWYISTLSRDGVEVDVGRLEDPASGW